MRDIFLKFNPKLKYLPITKKKLLLKIAQEGNMRTETLLEETISLASKKLSRSAKSGEDLSDGSEVKWCSFYKTKNGQTYSYTSKIGSVQNKKGTLRVAAYIDHCEEIQLFVIPARKWKLMTNGSGKKQIRLSYNTRTNAVSRISEFRVDWKSFISLK